MESDAKTVGAVLEIFSRAAGSEPPFPPAELFSEGWMLRLLMEGHHLGHNTLPIPLTEGSRWFSEARLSSPFQRSPGAMYSLHETETHADGVIGQFEVRTNTTAGLWLKDPIQFAVIEAKMSSKLSAGTKYAPSYNQAVRNVAAMAWHLDKSGVEIDDLMSVAFVIAAPRHRFEEEASFAELTQRSSLDARLRERVAAYEVVHPERHTELEVFVARTWEPLLENIQLSLWSWEEAISGVNDAGYASSLQQFYERCLAVTPRPRKT